MVAKKWSRKLIYSLMWAWDSHEIRMSELQLHFERISWLLIHQAKESEQSPSFRISLLKFPRFLQSNDVRTLSQYVCARLACFANVQKRICRTILYGIFGLFARMSSDVSSDVSRRCGIYSHSIMRKC